MGKKKHKKQSSRQCGWGEGGFGQGAGAAMGGINNAQGMGAGLNQGAWDGMLNNTAASNPNFLHGLQGIVGSRNTEQFIFGALIGAAAVYVLGDEEMRNKLLKAAMKLYAGVTGGVEEIKEQMADIRAEVEAEARG